MNQNSNKILAFLSGCLALTGASLVMFTQSVQTRIRSFFNYKLSPAYSFSYHSNIFDADGHGVIACIGGILLALMGFILIIFAFKGSKNRKTGWAVTALLLAALALILFGLVHIGNQSHTITTSPGFYSTTSHSIEAIAWIGFGAGALSLILQGIGMLIRKRGI